jgi:hypothetical protein
MHIYEASLLVKILRVKSVIARESGIPSFCSEQAWQSRMR